jgi:uncharacterized membrane protein
LLNEKNQNDAAPSRFQKTVAKLKNFKLLKRIFNPAHFRKQKIQKQVAAMEKKFSMKTKISVSIIVVLIILAPMVSMSLHYMN